MSKITKEQVEKLKEDYLKTLDLFLIQEGWYCSNTDYQEWGHNVLHPQGVLTNEEAFWLQVEN